MMPKYWREFEEYWPVELVAEHFDREHGVLVGEHFEVTDDAGVKWLPLWDLRTKAHVLDVLKKRALRRLAPKS